MDHTDIQTAIDAIVATMLVKGLREPRVSFSVDSGKETRAAAAWHKIGGSAYDNEYFHGKYGTPQETLVFIREWVDALPTIEERQRSDYAKLLAAALEYGTQAGFDDVLVNPLREAMEKLSHNILPDLSDDIPF